MIAFFLPGAKMTANSLLLVITSLISECFKKTRN